MSNREIKKYDKRNNLIYYKNLFGYERWMKYDKKDSYNKLNYFFYHIF